MIRIKQILHPKRTLFEDQLIAASIVSDVLKELIILTKPDVSLDMLDELTERMIRERGGIPFNKGYKPNWAIVPFPATLCCSINHEVCHAPPRHRMLQDGDIIKYDVGVRYKSGCGDAGLTVAVGNVDNRKKRAMRYGLETLYKGIEVVKADVPISAIGNAIEQFSGLHGYEIIKEYGGHHIGREMHMKPDIPHKYYKENDKVFLKEGSIICIEPMITPGHDRIVIDHEDKWTALCTDHQPVVMFEHMILVTVNGYEILTTHINENSLSN